MDFELSDAFMPSNFKRKDNSVGVDNPTLNPALGGRTFNQLAYLATDGRSSSWHQQSTLVFLRRCYFEAVEQHEDYRSVQLNFDSDEGGEVRQVLTERAKSCVPDGHYDRWLTFTDLIGWESDFYLTSIYSGAADLDDPSSIPAFVLFQMAENCIVGLIKEFQQEDRYNHGSAE